MLNSRGTDPPRPGGSTTMPAEDRQNRYPEARHLNFWAVLDSAPDACFLLAQDRPHFTMVVAKDARLRQP